MKEDFDFLRGLANCEDKEQMARYIEEHQPKPMTNADRIRAMSDEKLATWMAECNAYGERGDASQWLPWLQQPAEDL